MVFCGPKRKLLKSIGYDGRESDQIHEGYQELEKTEMRSVSNFPMLELETNIIYEILSRLSVRSTLACRCVCKTFLKLLKDDPYFAQLHLCRAPKSANLVIQKRIYDRTCLIFGMFELDQGLKAAPCSIDCQHSTCHTRNRFGSAVAKQNGQFCFFDMQATLVGECNGLLCLYSDSSNQSLYVVCNPILGEYVSVPYMPPSTTPAYSYFNLSAFGYCPKTGEYKVVHFARLASVDQLSSLARTEMVVDIQTLGSDSWKRIYDVPCPKIPGSFDPLLNGSLHWITESQKPAELLCSLNLETECFTFLPPPSHFSVDYMKKISGTNVGVFQGSLCMCYVSENSHFEAWVMKAYGVKNSWTKEFMIDINFYSGLRAVDFLWPLKFLKNGELWLHCSSNRLVSYSPQTGTFKDFDVLGKLPTKVILHYPSFISLQHALDGKDLTVVKVALDGRQMISVV